MGTALVGTPGLSRSGACPHTKLDAKPIGKCRSETQSVLLDEGGRGRIRPPSDLTLRRMQKAMGHTARCQDDTETVLRLLFPRKVCSTSEFTNLDPAGYFCVVRGLGQGNVPPPPPGAS